MMRDSSWHMIYRPGARTRHPAVPPAAPDHASAWTSTAPSSPASCRRPRSAVTHRRRCRGYVDRIWSSNCSSSTATTRARLRLRLDEIAGHGHYTRLDKIGDPERLLTDLVADVELGDRGTRGDRRGRQPAQPQGGYGPTSPPSWCDWPPRWATSTSPRARRRDFISHVPLVSRVR